MLDFRIDSTSGLAPYSQLVQQVKQALRLGWLQPGDKLPTAHEVAASVAINPNTVQKAYKELEQQGLVAGRPGQGTFVQRSLPNHAGLGGIADSSPRALDCRRPRRRSRRGRDHGCCPRRDAGF